MDAPGPLSAIARPLSLSEYYHACVASSRFTLEKPRDVVIVLRGHGAPGVVNWQQAIDAVARVHPGTRLRMVGKRSGARWQSDGLPPRVRLVEGCAWDAGSDRGADFVFATPLSLVDGPAMELIVAHGEGGRMTVILRALHAAIDGRGGMLILAELFRALRGEPLLGCTAGYSDFDYRRSVGTQAFPKQGKAARWPAPKSIGMEAGDMFRRISLGTPRRGQMAHVALAMAAYVHRHTDDPVLLGLPVDMRSAVPGLRTTGNFTNMMKLRIDKGSSVESFQRQIRERIAWLSEKGYPDVSDAIKHVPLPWLDLLVSRTRRNYRKPNRKMTACLSNLGRFDRADYAAEGFVPDDLALLPIPGDVFVTLACLGDRVEMMIGLPKVFADEASLDEFKHSVLQQPART